MVSSLSALASSGTAASQGRARPTTDAKPAPAPAAASTSTQVSLSAAAQAAAANTEEARETPAQTEQEAAHGDPQAKRLVARQAAVKAYAA
ncbi:hypothetical protein SNE35_05530 [Paucibacter sp. R3-3]|uniref:Uncharacterized protein n=1 Tax=Roseateles agri TaxID=3098619 RepID=A0ABU5DCE3_9BURK|nr:hypothetical protein [Paucibacter sp. R3-3]MDY0743953.1 hypothetical protein [Paucibacter sp. R3-3]